MGTLTDDLVIILVGIGFLAAAIFGAWKLSKDLKGMDFGEATAALAVDKHETIFVLCLFLLFIFSAITAASIRAVGEDPLNPLARIGSHILFNVIVCVCTITLVRDFITIFAPYLNWKEKLIRAGFALMLLAAGSYFAYLNLEIAVRSAGKMYEFELLKYRFWNGQAAYESFLIANGESPKVRASDLLPPPIHILIAELQAHIILVVIEGFRNAISKSRREMLWEKIYRELKIDPATGKSLAGAGPINPTGQSNPTAGQQRQAKELPKNAKFMLNRLGYDGTKLDTMTKEVESAILRIKDQDTRLEAATRLAKFVVDARTIDSGNAADKQAKNDALLKEVIAFFQGPVVGTDGKELSGDKIGLNLSIKGGGKKN